MHACLSRGRRRQRASPAAPLPVCQCITPARSRRRYSVGALVPALAFVLSANRLTAAEPPERAVLLAVERPAVEQLLVLAALGEHDKAIALWPQARLAFFEGQVSRADFLAAVLEYFLGFCDRGAHQEASDLAAALRTEQPQEPFWALLALLAAEYRGDRGEQDKLAGFFFDLYNEKLFNEAEPDAIALCSVARGVFRENPDSAKRAFRMLSEASGRLPDFLPAQWFAAEIAIARYHWQHARQTLEAMLATRPYLSRAVAALAHLDYMESNYARAEERAQQALALNPACTPALSLLARLAYTEEDEKTTLEHARRALALNAFEIPALALMLAAEGNQPAAIGQAEERLRPALGVRIAELHHQLAEAAAMRRRFEQAVQYERQAVERDREAWWAYYGAGVNLLRMGEETKALKALELSFQLNPFNLWCYNLLKVLDRDYKAGELAHVAGDTFTLKMPAREAAVYGQFVKQLLAGITGRYGKRWQLQARGPEGAPGPLVEVLPDHEDFSVRSVGLPNLGALGTCFGQVVVCPSPRVLASSRFEASYVTILRHEMSHVYTLQKSNYQVPRWLTEGIAMHDEGIPGYDWDRLLAYAVAEDVDVSLDRLNRYFGRPGGRRDVELAYAVSHFAVGWIRREWGAQTLDDMVAMYGKHGITAHSRVVSDALHLTLEGFHVRLKQAMREYVAKEVPLLPPISEAALERAQQRLLAYPRDKEALVTLVRGMWAAGRIDEVRAILPGAHSMHGHDPIVAGLYGQLLLEDGKPAEALTVLEKSLRPERRFWNTLLAGIAAERTGAHQKAADYIAVAERLMPHYISADNPADEPLRRLLARVLDGLGKGAEARGTLVRQLAATSADLVTARLLADMSLTAGDDKAAAAALEHIMQIDPFAGKYRLARARLMKRQGAVAGAFDEYRAAALLLDDAVEALREWLALGLDMAKTGGLAGEQAAELLEASRKLRAKAPDDALLKERAADLRRLGRRSEQ